MSETDDMTVNDNSVEPFKMSKEGVDYLNQKYLNRKFTEDIDYLEKLDGIKFITKSLLVNPESGLDEDESQREKRIDAFDSNESPPLEPINFCSFVLEAFEDKIIISSLVRPAGRRRHQRRDVRLGTPDRLLLQAFQDGLCLSAGDRPGPGRPVLCRLHLG